MEETIELTDIFLRVIGAFYAFGGYVATRAGLMSRLLDQAIAAISMKKPPVSERAQNAWLLATAACSRPTLASSKSTPASRRKSMASLA